jgi:hypothetical protein
VVWVAVKHFRELRQWTMGDFFTILLKTHALYFARLARDFDAAIFSR